MKLITFCVPCYNSESYMEKCVDSLLPGGDQVEILIVNDGSSDRTAQIADRYQAAYPGIVRAIHQENRGHGGAVMTGVKYARALYFKVVDSDDWVDQDAYREVIRVLSHHLGARALDMLTANFVYEKQGAKRKMVMRYTGALPKGRAFGWKDLKVIRPGQVLSMHAIIYRTSLVREARLNLPRHTFYVDNLFAYVPLPLVKRIYYLDVDFYRYFIGRADQSVNERMLIKRQDQQMRVVSLMIDRVDLEALYDKSLRRYMLRYLEMLMTITSVVFMLDGSPASLEKRDELWRALKVRQPWAYKRLIRRVQAHFDKAKSVPARGFVVRAYRFLQKMYGFN